MFDVRCESGQCWFSQSIILCVLPFRSYARHYPIYSCGSSGCSNICDAANTLQSLAEIQGKGSDDGENLSDREYYTNTTDGSQRRDSNLNERQDPQVTSDSGDCKHRRGSRRSADASRSTWPPLVGGPALAATGGTGEQTVVPQQPGKRGRAQKKRARKIKEKMRLLCIDANAASIAAAKGAGVSVGGTRSASPNVGVKLNASSPRQSVALNEGGSRNAGATYEKCCTALVELGAAYRFRVVFCVFMCLALILFGVQCSNARSG